MVYVLSLQKDRCRYEGVDCDFLRDPSCPRKYCTKHCAYSCEYVL